MQPVHSIEVGFHSYESVRFDRSYGQYTEYNQVLCSLKAGTHGVAVAIARTVAKRGEQMRRVELVALHRRATYE